ncbi:CPBP family intramembrane metalloprotease [Allokutzneria sp. A3M-2-11 16]|uniref:CPBP family intramembrane glutamic endopeptidase n=1 Tax=Allokutzneria sp. A3M-2-11 16 TaxID=2962043 RepID=UPI0020B7CE8D|nr:CPBP family intramembrane glutamic endopeptidase [Allokutzneria sp. A3M-2-11 16]MCP3801681.1 CPBP family intramembrane metalloprotease [Allokutzneria sp. A3M-2-11 16]
MHPYFRALLGTAAFAIALGVAGGSGTGHLVTALLCGGIAVPLIIVLCRQVDRRPLSDLDIRWSARSFSLGFLVTASSATITVGTATALGWLRWGPVDLLALLGFLGTNAVIAFALEALPEELAFRGYVFQNLREHHKQGWAMALTTALFMVAPGLSTVVASGISALLGGDSPPPSIAPAGEEPVSYLLLLALFGYTLLVARTATGSLWTNIALHLTFLSVNRIVLGRADGAPVEIVAPEALLAVPAYLVLTVATFKLITRYRSSTTSAASLCR